MLIAGATLAVRSVSCMPAARIANFAHAALIDELETWPKPGLVSLVDSGSHDDMDADTLRRSAAAIRPFFRSLAAAGADGACMATLRAIGADAEAAMMAATAGVNVHRGAIFSLGLICGAAGAAGVGAGPITAEGLATLVQMRWGEQIRATPVPRDSHGGRAAHRFGVGGAAMQAASGFPAVCRTGLPALGHGRTLSPADPGAARVQCFFALLATVDDTNLLHRGGADGLRDAQVAAAGFLADGGVGAEGWRDAAVRIHRAFVARRLSPGGCADLLATTLLLDALETATCER